MNIDLQNDDYIYSWDELSSFLHAADSKNINYNNLKIDEKKFFEIYNSKKNQSYTWFGKRVFLIPWHAILCPAYRVVFMLFAPFNCLISFNKTTSYMEKQRYHLKQNFNLAKGYCHSLWNLEKSSLTIYRAQLEKYFYDKKTNNKTFFNEISEKCLKIIDKDIEKLGEKNGVEKYRFLINACYIDRNRGEEFLALAEKYPTLFALMKRMVSLPYSMSFMSGNLDLNRCKELSEKIQKKFPVPTHFNHYEAYLKEVRHLFRELAFTGSWQRKKDSLIGLIYVYKMGGDFNNPSTIATENTIKYFDRFCDKILFGLNSEELQRDIPLVERLNKLNTDRETPTEFTEEIDAFNSKENIISRFINLLNTVNPSNQIKKINDCWQAIIKDYKNWKPIFDELEGNSQGFDLLLDVKQKEIAFILLLSQKRVNKKFPKPLNMMIIKRLV